jgi:hypothetical protein
MFLLRLYKSYKIYKKLQYNKNTMLNKLPVYAITIDDAYSENGEDLGINKIAFTATPAIITKGLAFNEDGTKEMFFADKTKYRVVAPIMKPAQIYRADESGEYYVTFSAQEIEKIYAKFMKNFTNRQVFNLEHDNSQPVQAYVLESWIVDSPTQDKALSSYGIDVPAGTVMMSAQFTNKDAYNEIVENGQFGFSIEGFLGLSLSDIINKQKQKNEKMSEQKMSMPAGQYQMGNSIYTVLEDGTFTVAEMAAAPPADAKPADAKPADAPPADKASGDTATALAAPVPPADATAPAPAQAPADAGSNTYSKEEIDAKLDEIMQVIAQLKAEDEAEDAALIEPLQQGMSEIKMSTNELVDAFIRFGKASKHK